MVPTKAVGGGRKLMTFRMVPEKWEGTGDLGLIARCFQDDIQCLKCAQTFPHMCSDICRNRPTQNQLWSMLHRDVWPKRVTYHGVTGLFRQTWWMILPRRDSAGNKESGFQRESQTREVRVTHMIHVWPDRKKAKNNSSSHENSQTTHSH